MSIHFAFGETYGGGIEVDAREGVGEVTPRGDEHGSSGWGQARISDNLQQRYAQPTSS